MSPCWSFVWLGSVRYGPEADPVYLFTSLLSYLWRLSQGQSAGSLFDPESYAESLQGPEIQREFFLKEAI